MIKKQFSVVGMSCASCASSVETILSSREGVGKAEVSFPQHSVWVEYSPDVITPQQMKTALQDIGYDLLVDEPSEKLEEIQRKEAIGLRRRTLAAISLSIPLVIIGMFFMDMSYADYWMWGLATPVVLWFGRSFFVNAFKQARHGRANMDTLVALSTGISYLFSVFNTLFPGYWHERGLHAHVYFEASAVVVAFILLGKWLEERAKARTSSAIKKLMGLQPNAVTLIGEDGMVKVIPLAEVRVGDRLLVRPGDRIAVDGVVAEGSSYVDESMISGEPIAIVKKPGDSVFAGTINQKGSFRYTAEKVGEDTLLAHIVKMVQEAQGSKAPVQKLVDKVAGIFVPVVIGLAVISFLTWWIWGGANGLTYGLLSLVTVLVIACPCALGLATPTAIMVGVGRGAEQGILIRDAESLEQAYKVDTLIMDKTGTLTEGRPAVTDIYEVVPGGRAILLSLEQASEHPLASAVAAWLEKDNRPVTITDIESLTGRGIRGRYEGHMYWVGSRQLMEEIGVELAADVQQWVEEKNAAAQTVIFFAGEGSIRAVLAIEDSIKPSAQNAIAELKREDIEVHMLTGDGSRTAAAVAARIGISSFKAEVSPMEKAAYIKTLQQQGKVVAMAGDGINDSQALAQADVSIAMGTGSDIAMDVAGITLLSEDLSRLPAAIRLSRATVRTVRQNLFWAFIYNLIGIPVAAGVLYPINGFLLNPMIAGAAMALSSVSVVSNSLRLKYKKL
ncbi:MAG TPA: heavy metal translocating P-type ATPase [Puia sp.]|nr:heavy metal translocating P-type ATPase [Puia sp.]